jgi:hypothetical protein
LRIYKYTSVENALKTLRESRIKVSSSDELNDPFEFAPLINSTAFTLESCLKFLCQPEQIEHWYQIEGLPKGLSRSEFEIAYLDSQSLRNRATTCMLDIESKARQTSANFPQIINQFFRFFFASKTRESILNWSHYACEHQGVAIEFETEQSPFSHLPRELKLDVQYKAEKSSFYWSNDIEITKRELLNVASRKWKDWEYESEVRFAFPVTVCSESRFVGLHPKAVRSITFGCRHMKNGMTESLRTLMSELHSTSYQHVGIWEAIPKANEFALDFVLRRAETKNADVKS